MATKREIAFAWGKARAIPGISANILRKDTYGNKIRKQSYGTHGEYGWQVDHKNPRARGGSESLRNKQALHWRENLSKGAKYPWK